MSATNRGSQIISQEFYPTPEYTTISILNEINWSNVQSFTEPCKGAGHIFNLIPDTVKDKYYCELSEGTDYLQEVLPEVDLVLTNPPFSLAQRFIEKARTESNCVIMLQRLNYLGSQSRKQFWNDNPPTHLFVLANRPKFIAKCTNKDCSDTGSYQVTEPAHSCLTCSSPVRPCSDATEYAWFCWDTANILYKERGIYSV